MSFRLFRVDVHIQGSFWLTALMFGYVGGLLTRPLELVIFTVAMFVSVLVHEFGHALAIMRHRVTPEISLHGMGGTTSWRMILPLRRIDRVLISLAGPFAGFFVGAALFALKYFAPGVVHRLPGPAVFAIDTLFWMNVYWGILNLLPVLPFDGGHVLEHALGPKRIKLTYLISMFVGALVTVYCIKTNSLFGALIFGWGAIQSFLRWRAEGPGNASQPSMPQASVPPRSVPPPLPFEYASMLRRGRTALSEENAQQAIEIGQRVLEGRLDDGRPTSEGPPIQAVHGALEIIAWAHLLSGRTDDAQKAMDAARRIDSVDPALNGAILFARGDLKEARRVLEAARASGDERKEVVGPLIQILIQQREIPRAAAVAFDIVDSLSEEDARKMAEIAFDGGAFDWSARLYESIFRRKGHADDAYNTARALARDGASDRALEYLQQAVEAGFSDRARAWSDAALEALRSNRMFETVMPRP